MTNLKSRPGIKGLIFFLAGGIASLALLGLIAFISNINLPTGPEITESLAPIDKVRLDETIHLKFALGDDIWPGWGQMEIPVLIWHAQNSFLFGLNEVPPGWKTVAGDQFQGREYFWNANFDPKNFAMLINGQWVAGMATKGETDLFIQNIFREIIPDFLEPFFPYRLLTLKTEVQISGVLHETYHVFQAQQSPVKFELAEASYGSSDEYWQVDKEMGADWRMEMDLLIDAVQAETTDSAEEYTRSFISAREHRRAAHRLSPEQVSFEQQAEWLEGLAKYVELSVWEAASNPSKYQPISEMAADPNFKDYKTFQQRWKQEISQARRQAESQGDVRFYYSGMLQARLLDRLSSDWKTRIMADDIYLEHLLKEAILP